MILTHVMGFWSDVSDCQSWFRVFAIIQTLSAIETDRDCKKERGPFAKVATMAHLIDSIVLSAQCFNLSVFLEVN